MASRPNSPAFLVALGTMVVSASGCRGCNEDPPYTPFGIASATYSAPPSTVASPPAPPDPDRTFQLRSSRRAPKEATRWQLDGISLVAPASRSFELGLVADFDGDQTPDVVAWTAPTAAAGVETRGELWFFPGRGESRRLLELPAFVPSGSSCTVQTTLTQTGPHTVTVDATGQCSEPLIARAPVRAIAVIAPASSRELVLLVRAAPAAPGETLDVTVDSTDRDGDGRDDVRLSVRVQAVNTERPATARLLWLDRAAGPSRQPQEPRASLEQQASVEQVRAKGNNTSRTVAHGVGNLRRLVASLCDESGSARLFDAEGAALRCGDLQLVVDRLAAAEVQAGLTRGDVREALASLARDGWYGSPTSAKERGRLEGLARQACRPIRPAEIVTVKVSPPRPSGSPRWSPLTFEQPEPTLLVQTETGLVRVSSDGNDVQRVEPGSGVPAWPLAVVAPNGSVWTGIVQACNRSELVLGFGGSPEPQVTRLLAARPGVCAGGAMVRTPPPAPLGWGDRHRLQAVVAGALVGPGADGAGAGLPPPAPGSPRSPDGSLLVTSSPLGLLITGTDQPELWHAPELEPWHDLGDCVMSNRASAVACVKGPRVLLLRR